MNKKEMKHIIQRCIDANWRIRDGKHYVVYPSDPLMPPIAIPKTPSDYRGYQNLLSSLRKRGLP